MHRCFVILSVSLILSCLQTGFEPAAMGETPQEIRVGAYDNHPKIYTGPDGRVLGFWAELLDQIALSRGCTIQYVPGTWSQGLDRLSRHEIDIMPDVAHTPSRENRFDFSRDAVIVSWSRIYVHDKNSDIHAITDLSGKTVAVLKDSVNYGGPGGLAELIRGFNIRCAILEFPSYADVFKAVENGIADAGLTNRDFGFKNKKQYSVRQTTIVFQPISIRFAFPKNGDRNPVLIPAIDRTMETLQENPGSVYYRLLNQYFETGVSEKVIEVLPGWLSLTLKITGAGCLFLILVVLVSRRQVRTKTRELNLKNQDLLGKKTLSSP